MKGGPLVVSTYLRVSKASKPARAVLRFFYLFISNPSQPLVSFTKGPALLSLSGGGLLAKTPFNAL